MPKTRAQTHQEMAENIARGDTDKQYILEWVQQHSSDPLARDLCNRLFAQVEGDEEGEYE